MRRIVALAAALAAAGCIVPVQQPQPEYEPAPRPRPRPQPQPVPQPVPPPPQPMPQPAPVYQPPPPPQFGDADNARWLSALRLTFALPKRDYAQGESIFAMVTLANVGGEPVPVHALDAGAVNIVAMQGGREIMRCRPGALRPGGNVYALQPNQRVSADLNVTERCGALAPGDYSFAAELDLPGPWSVAAQGRLSAEAFARVEKPRQAALALSLRIAGAPETLNNAPAPLEAVVNNFGDAPGHIRGEGALMLEGTDDMGRPVRCSAGGFGPDRDVFPGQNAVLRVNAAERCDLSRPGTYALSAKLPSQQGVLQSNAVTLFRRAAAPRAELQLVASAWGRWVPGRDYPIAVRLVNRGPDATYVYGFAPELVQVQAFGDGRPLPCQGLGRADPRDASRYQLVRAGGELAGRVDLARACRLSGDRIEVRLAYAVGPEYDGRAWNMQAWTGTAAAQPVYVEGEPAPAPVAMPHVSVRFPARVDARLNGAALAILAVVNDGPVPASIVRPSEDAVRVMAWDSFNRPVGCTAESRLYGPQDTLMPGQQRMVTVDVAHRCGFGGPGQYRVELHYATASEGPAMAVDATGEAQLFLAGGPPPPMPGPARPPHVSVAFQPQVVTRVGWPVTVEVTLTSDGGGTADIAAPGGQWVTAELRDPRGQPVICRKPPQNFMPVRVRLDPGQSRTTSVDLSSYCAFHGPGEYRGQLRYDTVGMGGMTPVNGAGSVLVRITPGGGGDRDRDRDRDHDRDRFAPPGHR